MQTLKLAAPAKINLHLRVARPTADGFHPLLTWMCTVSFFDTLTFTRLGPRVAGDLIQLSCDDPSLACDASNLVVRTGQRLAEALRSRNEAIATREGGGPANFCKIAIHLQKRIPTGAGLGGGSVDGAISLVGLNRLWNAGFSAEQLAEWSGTCGSDLPFFSTVRAAFVAVAEKKSCPCLRRPRDGAY